MLIIVSVYFVQQIGLVYSKICIRPWIKLPHSFIKLVIYWAGNPMFYILLCML